MTRAAILACLACLAACGGSSPPQEASPFEILEEPAPPAAVERAREAARTLGSTLLARLSDEMDRGGPEAALVVCSQVAQQTTGELSSDGLTVRRVSLRVRNPLDRPDPYERHKLEELERLHVEGRGPAATAEVVRADGIRSLRFLKPLVVGDACLVCHGARDQIDPGVLEALAARYPEDEATGYSTGDFRGAISVTVELDG